jgi:hypothetical protein
MTERKELIEQAQRTYEQLTKRVAILTAMDKLKINDDHGDQFEFNLERQTTRPFEQEPTGPLVVSVHAALADADDVVRRGLMVLTAPQVRELQSWINEAVEELDEN